MKKKRTLTETLDIIAFVTLIVAFAVFFCATLNLMNYYMEADKPSQEYLDAEQEYIDALKLYIKYLKEELDNDSSD